MVAKSTFDAGSFVLIVSNSLQIRKHHGGRAGSNEQVAAPVGQKLKPSEPVLFFQEELNAIQVVVAGQGVGICSDILVRRELAGGESVKVSDVTPDRYGIFLVHRRGDSRKSALATLRESPIGTLAQ